MSRPRLDHLPAEGPITLAEALAAVADLVPSGRAVTYGDLVRLLGRGGPRQAGRAMAEAPEGTPWWRVVRADGSLPPDLETRAGPARAAEGTPLTPTGRVDLRRARWDPAWRERSDDEAALATIVELSARVG